MKSGLGQNETLKALRIVIDNVDGNTLNENLRQVVAFEKQLKYFKDWKLKPPHGVDEWMEKNSEPISDHELQEHYTRSTYKMGKYRNGKIDYKETGVRTGTFWDPLLSLRRVARHVGYRQRWSIMEAVYKKHYQEKIVMLWSRMYSVLFYAKFNGFSGEFFSYDSYSPWYDDDDDGEL